MKSYPPPFGQLPELVAPGRESCLLGKLENRPILHWSVLLGLFAHDAIDKYIIKTNYNKQNSAEEICFYDTFSWSLHQQLDLQCKTVTPKFQVRALYPLKVKVFSSISRYYGKCTMKNVLV